MTAKTILIIIVTSLCACTGEFPHDPAHVGAATDAYDTTGLIDQLESIKTWHVENNTGVAARLRPGLSESAFPAKIVTSRCRLTEELKALWSWHDGAPGAVPFIWYHDFLSLEQAISEYKWLVLNPFVAWDPNYIPVLSFEGEWYAAYCGGPPGAAGPVIHYFLEDGARLTAVNLTALMRTMAQAFAADAVTWENGGMVEDLLKVREIHRANNPGYEFPYAVLDGT